uniref:Uncharacterized protein n=1 Tax=Trypanosoma vivax (strain Y486) TaxID=1055687 RepID=G0TWD9_TRYVY|nr:conserved hypothetical protein, fragment [Trypanosoma vivax Y486]
MTDFSREAAKLLRATEDALCCRRPAAASLFLGKVDAGGWSVGVGNSDVRRTTHADARAVAEGMWHCDGGAFHTVQDGGGSCGAGGGGIMECVLELQRQLRVTMKEVSDLRSELTVERESRSTSLSALARRWKEEVLIEVRTVDHQSRRAVDELSVLLQQQQKEESTARSLLQQRVEDLLRNSKAKDRSNFDTQEQLREEMEAMRQRLETAMSECALLRVECTQQLEKERSALSQRLDSELLRYVDMRNDDKRERETLKQHLKTDIESFGKHVQELVDRSWSRHAAAAQRALQDPIDAVVKQVAQHAECVTAMDGKVQDCVATCRAELRLQTATLQERVAATEASAAVVLSRVERAERKADSAQEAVCRVDASANVVRDVAERASAAAQRVVRRKIVRILIHKSQLREEMEAMRQRLETAMSECALLRVECTQQLEKERSALSQRLDSELLRYVDMRNDDKRERETLKQHLKTDIESFGKHVQELVDRSWSRHAAAAQRALQDPIDAVVKQVAQHAECVTAMDGKVQDCVATCRAELRLQTATLQERVAATEASAAVVLSRVERAERKADSAQEAVCRVDASANVVRDVAERASAAAQRAAIIAQRAEDAMQDRDARVAQLEAHLSAVSTSEKLRTELEGVRRVAQRAESSVDAMRHFYEHDSQKQEGVQRQIELMSERVSNCEQHHQRLRAVVDGIADGRVPQLQQRLAIIEEAREGLALAAAKGEDAVREQQQHMHTLEANLRTLGERLEQLRRETNGSSQAMAARVEAVGEAALRCETSSAMARSEVERMDRRVCQLEGQSSRLAADHVTLQGVAEDNAKSTASLSTQLQQQQRLWLEQREARREAEASVMVAVGAGDTRNVEIGGVVQQQQQFARELQAYRAKIDSLSNSLSAIDETLDHRLKDFAILQDLNAVRRSVKALESELRVVSSSAQQQQLYEDVNDNYELRLKKLEVEHRSQQQVLKEIKMFMKECRDDVHLRGQPLQPVDDGRKSVKAESKTSEESVAYGSEVTNISAHGPPKQVREVQSPATEIRAVDTRDETVRPVGKVEDYIPQDNGKEVKDTTAVFGDVFVSRREPDRQLQVEEKKNFSEQMQGGKVDSETFDYKSVATETIESEWDSYNHEETPQKSSQRSKRHPLSSPMPGDDSVEADDGKRDPKPELASGTSTIVSFHVPASSKSGSSSDEVSPLAAEVTDEKLPFIQVTPLTATAAEAPQDNTAVKKESTEQREAVFTNRQRSVMHPPSESSSSSEEENGAQFSFRSKNQSEQRVSAKVINVQATNMSSGSFSDTPAPLNAAGEKKVDLESTTVTESIREAPKRTSAWYDDWDDDTESEVAAPAEEAKGDGVPSAQDEKSDESTDKPTAQRQIANEGKREGHEWEAYTTQCRQFVHGGDMDDVVPSVPRHGVSTSSGSSHKSKEALAPQPTAVKQFTSFDDTTSDED